MIAVWVPYPNIEFEYGDGRLSDVGAIGVQGQHEECKKYCLEKRSGSDPCIGYTFIKNSGRNVCHLKTKEGTRNKQLYWAQDSGNLTKISKNMIWKNELGEYSSMRIQPTDSAYECQQACKALNSNSNTTNCVGFTFQAIGKCYLKNSFDASFLQPVPLEKHSALIKGILSIVLISGF